MNREAFIILQEINPDSVLTESEFAGKVHPTILRLGLGYANSTIRGGNARAVALLTALSQMFQVWHWRYCVVTEVELLAQSDAVF